MDEISADTIFTTVITIFIFGLSYLASKLFEDYKEKKRLEELETYYRTSIELWYDPIEKQSSYLIKFAGQLKEKIEIDFEPKSVSSLHVETIFRK